MDNPAFSSPIDPDATTIVAIRGDDMPVSSPHELALSRIWTVINLVAVAAVATVMAPTASPGLVAGWASFTLLNALLHLASRTGTLVGNAASSSPSFNTGIAAMLGMAWGGGVLLLLPGTSAMQLSVLMAAAFAVSLIGIPVFATKKNAFHYFLATLTVLSVAALVREPGNLLTVLWVLIANGCLLVAGSVFYRSHTRLQSLLEKLLQPATHGFQSADSHGGPIPEQRLPFLVHEKLAALDSLYSANERSQRLLRALSDATIATDADGTIDYINPAAEALLGGSHKEFSGQPVEAVLRIVSPPDKRNQAREIFDQLRLTHRVQQTDENAQLVRRDGVAFGIEYIVSEIKDERAEFVGASYVLRDVTAKRQRTQSVEWQATHDPLTGSINRGEFEIRLKKLVRRSQDDNRNAHSLLYLDIDRFSALNGNYGNAAGDAVLKTVTEVLRSRIRGADTLARVGGDEFSALLYSCPADKARQIAESLRAAIERHDFKWQGSSLSLSISIGIVAINHECKSVAEIMRAANSACFAAKKFGRNRVQLFERSENVISNQARVFDFVKDIQTAIDGNRLELFYQPIYAAAGRGNNREEKQCELSVGVRNKDELMIPRSELAELGQRHHLTEEVDRWVVKAALDALRLNHPALSAMNMVLVPLSQQAMTNERLLSYISDLVKDNPDYSPRIGFSFENANVAGRLDHARHFVSTLKQYGCRLMIGDLGFGSDAIDLVKSSQADFLGIRATLVDNMLHNSVDYEVVVGLSRIARTLGMQTIAEHAQTKSQRDALVKMGVHYTKGHLSEQPRRVSIYSEAQWV